MSLSRLLALIGDAHRHRCCFRLADCEACIRQLPRGHYNTAWAQNTLGLAYFHHHQYKTALKYFAASHKAEPFRLEGTEFYSTVMWILKMEHDLASLAQHCLSVSRMRPQSWCVVGNCFSLNRECDSAIKYFQRAVQCDSSFACAPSPPAFPSEPQSCLHYRVRRYAYTLAGHEHHQNDDFECAMQSFRAALKCQPRHYQAWYGIGMVFQKQERLSSAEYRPAAPRQPGRRALSDAAAAGITSAVRARSTPATRASTRSWAPSCWSGKRARIWTRRASCWKGKSRTGLGFYCAI
jgi:anaphase-promoting complex subunit 3